MKNLPIEQARIALRNIFHLDWSRKNELFQGTIIGPEEKILNSRDAINSATKMVMIELGYLEQGKNQENREV